MILREQHDQILFITHAERCRVAETLAERVGNNQFHALSSSVRLAAKRFDLEETDEWQTFAHGVADAWPDIIQADRMTLLNRWEAAARAAAGEDPYAGLLITLLGFWNSINASASQRPDWDAQQTRVRFDLNRFQHAMIELLEALRQQCGLPIDRPLKHGLSENPRDPRERQLRCDFEWVQLLDRLSDAICRARPPAAMLSVRARGSSKIIDLTSDISHSHALLRPWPFDRSRIELTLNARVSERQNFLDVTQLRAAIVAAPHKTFAIELGPLTI